MKKWLAALILCTSTAVGAVESTPPQTDEAITIYFARHGKTLFNTFDRVQGWADSPLTEDGIRVARYLGEGLKGIKFDSYYSSDAGRQRETMAVILRQAGVKDYQLIELPGLREAFFGGFEGGWNKDMADAGARQLGMKDGGELFSKMKAGELTQDQSQNALAAADPKGLTENYQQVKQRTQAALHTIVDNAKARGEKNVLAISSGTSMQIMISDLTTDPARNKPLSNAAVVKVVYQNGKYTVPEIGSMKYVEAGKQALDNNK
ncbi:histidine phosphatase family protein [Serratia rubidaea]|uniref:histidine phosphatase family protein n=1 Tax=Serratia rubidaea TaxID=61652 RepID=UPI001F19AE0E|nr:histidine phosphatase family protein [Serratia rubidaea]UJD78642.1 histidine phosphatase family protein [Serratia rubidaea]UJD83193.1 histidine phosphatase family protein [Serratia rubidaea]